MKEISELTDRELDEAIAIEVLKYKWIPATLDPFKYELWPESVWKVNQNVRCKVRPEEKYKHYNVYIGQFSKYIGNAEDVIEVMKKKGFCWRLASGHNWFAELTKEYWEDNDDIVEIRFVGKAPKLPRAICEAALMCVRGQG